MICVNWASHNVRLVVLPTAVSYLAELVPFLEVTIALILIFFLSHWQSSQHSVFHDSRTNYKM